MNKRIIRTTLTIVLSVIALGPSVSLASPSNTEVIKNIRELYAHTNQVVGGNKVITVKLYSEAGSNGDGYDIKRWHLSDDHQHYTRGAYEVHAYVYQGRIILVRFDVESQVDDWHMVMAHYFYKNGRLAFLFEGNVTYNALVVKDGKKVSPDGPVVLEKRSYYTKNGKKIRFLEKAYMENTGEKVPIDQVQDIKLKTYDTVHSLPFYALMNDKLAQDQEKEQKGSK